MGKSMSTAKQVSRSPVVNAPKEIALNPKPNQEIVRKVQLQPNAPDAEYLKKVNNFNKTFNDRLKQVYVTSVDKNASFEKLDESMMPRDRSTPFMMTPHEETSDERKPNKLFIDDIKVLLINHKVNPGKWNIDYIASRYDISKEIAEKLITNYASLETFYGNAESESDKYLVKNTEEKVNRIVADTTVEEMEDIMVQGRDKKWLSKEDYNRIYGNLKKEKK